MSWHCPSCNASCRTPETLGIHVSKCRAMSVEEIELIVRKFDSTNDEQNGVIDFDSYVSLIAKAIHAFHVAKLRGRKP